MKRVFCAGLTVLALFLCSSLELRAGSWKVRFAGAGNYLQGGDLNLGLQGWTDFWKGSWNKDGFTEQTGSYQPVHIGWNAACDVILQLSPRWGLGVGTEYIAATKSAALSFRSPASTTVMNWDISGKVSAIPAKLSLFFSMPLGDSLSITLHAGAGYYWAKTRLESRQDVNPNIEYIIDSSAKGTGYHGGLALEIKLSSGMSLFLEGAGRYAELSGFEGTTKIANDGSWNGKLYYWEAKRSWIARYGYIDLLGGPPGGSDVFFVREAKIDFSGFSLRAGIQIRI